MRDAVRERSLGGALAHILPIPAILLAKNGPTCAARTHISLVPAIQLARNGTMCARGAHMPRVRAADSRTCPLFRPTSRPYGTKPAEVRAHLPLFSGVPRAHPSASRQLSAPSSRTSPGFLAAARFLGRKPAQVREPLAGSRHRCARRAHLSLVPAIPVARNGRMCAGKSSARTSSPSRRSLPAGSRWRRVSRSGHRASSDRPSSPSCGRAGSHGRAR